MKPFNQELVERVNSVFGKLNSDSLANDGWEALKPRLARKQPKKRVLIIAFPLYAKAAVIIILIGIGWVLNQQLIKHASLSHPEERSLASSANKLIITPSTPPAPLQRALQDTLLPHETVSLCNAPKATEPIAIAIEASIDSSQAPIGASNRLSTEHLDTAAQHAQPPLLVTSPKANGFFADISEIEQPSSTAQRNGLEIGVSSMLTLMDDAKASSPGMSVGVFASRRITQKIAITPGVKINRQDFSLSSLPQNHRSDYLANDAAIGSNSNEHTTSTEARVKVISLEIPINITFTLFQNSKHKLSLSTGLSSLAYIKQTFEQQYNVKKDENVFNASSNKWEQVTLAKSYSISNEYGAFKRLDLFKLVNLSIGYEIPIRRDAITIEPFIQIPIGGITSNNMLMGNGGLTIKYSLF